MRRFLIGEVCDALGVKPHVVRYWEQQVAMLSPPKNKAGRRVYSPRDLQILFRIKYLIQKRMFTLEGAAQKILEEASGSKADRKANIQRLRETILDISVKNREASRKLERLMLPEGFPAEQRVLLAGWQRRGAAIRRDLEQKMRRWYSPAFRPLLDITFVDGASAFPVESVTRGGGKARFVGKVSREKEVREAAEEVLASSGLAVVSPLPDWAGRPEAHPVLQPLSPGRGVSALQLTGERIRALSYEYGKQPRWYIVSAETNAAAVEHLLRRRHYFGLRPDHVHLVVYPDLPVRDAHGTILTDGTLRPYVYTSNMLAAVVLLGTGQADGAIASRYDMLLFVPLTNPLARVCDLDLIGLHATRDAELTVKAVSASAAAEVIGEKDRSSNPPTTGRFISTGAAVLSPRFLSGVLPLLGSNAHTARYNALKAGEEDDENHEVDGFRFAVRMRDLIQWARSPVILGADARQEFCRLKNSKDIAACRRRLAELYGSWANGTPRHGVREVPPLYALDRATYRARSRLEVM